MSFLRPVQKQMPVAAPSTVSSPGDLFNSMARLRRAKGGRNAFVASQTSSAAGADPGAGKPNTLTGISG